MSASAACCSQRGGGTFQLYICVWHHLSEHTNRSFLWYLQPMSKVDASLLVVSVA